MEKVVGDGALGVSNAKGFYPYTPESAENWEKTFIEFSYDIRKLAEKYAKKI
jgi:3-hydroxybutyryl-CoA dehydrogenase